MKKKTAREVFASYLTIALGTVVYAAGFQFFLYPNSIIVGGLSGIAMIINLLTDLPVGALTVVLNIPLFVVAWRYFGKHFIVGSLVGVLLSSLFIDLFALLKFSPTDDMLLACIIGGAVKGVGLGLYIVKTIINMHDGEITARSENGKYIEFCFEIPD